LRYAMQENPMFRCASSGLMKGRPCLKATFMIYLRGNQYRSNMANICCILELTLVRKSGQISGYCKDHLRSMVYKGPWPFWEAWCSCQEMLDLYECWLRLRFRVSSVAGRNTTSIQEFWLWATEYEEERPQLPYDQVSDRI
jgi:hypothetical protein